MRIKIFIHEGYTIGDAAGDATGALLGESVGAGIGQVVHLGVGLGLGMLGGRGLAAAGAAAIRVAARKMECSQKALAAGMIGGVASILALEIGGVRGSQLIRVASTASCTVGAVAVGAWKWLRSRPQP